MSSVAAAPTHRGTNAIENATSLAAGYLVKYEYAYVFVTSLARGWITRWCRRINCGSYLRGRDGTSRRSSTPTTPTLRLSRRPPGERPDMASSLRPSQGRPRWLKRVCDSCSFRPNEFHPRERGSDVQEVC